MLIILSKYYAEWTSEIFAPLTQHGGHPVRAVDLDTAPQAGRSRVRFQMGSLVFFHCINPSVRTMALRSRQPLTEMSRGQLKCDGTRAETRFRLSAKRTSPFKSAEGRQFSRLLTVGVCASAVVMLDTPCSEVVWRVLATHSIRQFPLHFTSRGSPCALILQLESTSGISWGEVVKVAGA